MKVNKFSIILSFCFAAHGISIAMEPSKQPSPQSSQSWYDWGTSGINATASYGKGLYDQLPNMWPSLSASEKQPALQEKKAQEQDFPKKTEQVNHCQSTARFTVLKKENYGIIYDEITKDKYRIEKLAYGCPESGIYFVDSKDKVTFTTNDKEKVRDQLVNLIWSNHVLSQKDKYHNFPECLEKCFGEWARVMITSNTTGSKKFDFRITIPGSINGQKGVFEFVVEKNSYEEQGICTHRFFNPDGVCGATKIGKKNKNNINSNQSKK